MDSFKEFVVEDHTGHDHAPGEPHDDGTKCYIREYRKKLGS